MHDDAVIFDLILVLILDQLWLQKYPWTTKYINNVGNAQ